jgi:hypothetical protein
LSVLLDWSGCPEKLLVESVSVSLVRIGCVFAVGFEGRAPREVAAGVEAAQLAAAGDGASRVDDERAPLSDHLTCILPANSPVGAIR